jgi:hypothetical protein
LKTARPRPQAPCGPNQVWSYDFVFDHCANGQQLKCLTVTDEFTKEGLAIDVDGRIRSPRVIEVLSRLVSERGAPTFLRSDNGPEFVSKALLSWILAQGTDTAWIEPGKPGRMVSTHRLKKGADMLKRYGSILDRIEQQFGVPPSVIVAIWGLETDFGTNLGKFPTFRSLASLAYDCRRSALFQAELLDVAHFAADIVYHVECTPPGGQVR